MKSWDCWDTLIARRSVVDVYDENLNVFPIAENVSKVQQDDILVSDYYNEALLTRILPEITGLRNKIIVTASGKYSGTIWKTLLQHGVTEHTGDNPFSDVEVPRRYGLRATLSDLSKYTPEEQRLDEAGLKGLARSMREARLTSASVTLRPLEMLQTQINYPLLFLASIVLQRNYPTSRFLMSSRDCCLWQYAQELVRGISGADYEIVYFKTSRICRAFPSESYLDYVNHTLPGVIVDIAGTGWSLSRLLQQSRHPDTQIVFITRYKVPRLQEEYDRIGRMAWQGHIDVLLPESTPPADLETMNTATHAMYTDTHSVWNPINIPWEQRPEINVMHSAFMRAIKAAAHYDFSSDLNSQSDLCQEQMSLCLNSVSSYSSDLDALRILLCSESDAVISRLRSMSGRNIGESPERFTHKPMHVKL